MKKTYETPEILLADEPTGALDTKTSKQIMNLIREIAGERLVIMVTHNPELADEYADRALICKCNVDECDDVPMNYNIRSIPTLIFFKNGEVVDRHVGAASKADLSAKINSLH